jgi:hypothetical protein
MPRRRSRWFRFGPAAGWGLALALLPGLGTRAGAQSIGADPYDPWNAMYRPFIYPTAPLNPGMPGQGRGEAIPGVGAASQFGQYLESIGVGTSADPFGRPGGGRTSTSRFTPYWQSYRPSAGPYDRTYQANPNDTFYADQQRREQEYYEASRIKDPKKRAEALRRLDQERLKALRAGSAGRSSRATARAKGAAPDRAAPAASNPSRSAGVSAEPRQGSISSELFRRDQEEPGATFSNSETLRRSRAIGRLRRTAPATEAGTTRTAPPADSPTPALPADETAEPR